MWEYYAYKLQISTKISLFHLGGRLLQQFIVDMYIKIETSRLMYFAMHQNQIQSDLYQGIVDIIHAGEARATMARQRIVLPTSFIGGPHDMRRRYMDAMALV
jgi:Helitron helicase-like domain at N-terminus